MVDFLFLLFFLSSLFKSVNMDVLCTFLPGESMAGGSYFTRVESGGIILYKSLAGGRDGKTKIGS